MSNDTTAEAHEQAHEVQASFDEYGNQIASVRSFEADQLFIESPHPEQHELDRMAAEHERITAKLNEVRYDEHTGKPEYVVPVHERAKLRLHADQLHRSMLYQQRVGNESYHARMTEKQEQVLQALEQEREREAIRQRAKEINREKAAQSYAEEIRNQLTIRVI